MPLQGVSLSRARDLKRPWFMFALYARTSRNDGAARPRHRGRKMRRVDCFDQIAGLDGFFGLRGLSSGSAPARKYTRQPGESCDLFWIMQAVMRSTSGTYAPHSRIASGVQACCCSGV